MGWKGTLRSIQAAQHQLERSAVAHQRALQRQAAQAEKLAELDRARYEVAVYENQIELATGVHRVVSEPIEWRAIAVSEPPAPPTRQTTHTDAAEAELAAFVPSRLLKGRSEAKRQALEDAVSAAEEADEEEYQTALSDHAEAVADWRESVALAREMLHRTSDAYVQAIEKLSPFADLAALGSSIRFRTEGGDDIEARLRVHGKSVIPTHSKSLLQSGKLSTKEINKTRFYDLYQDYVCACVLRIAQELFALLPVERAFVTAIDELLDSSTGLMAEQPILSVAVQRATIERMDVQKVDPSDALANFAHRMNFKKTSGFQPVQPLTPADLH